MNLDETTAVANRDSQALTTPASTSQALSTPDSGSSVITADQAAINLSPEEIQKLPVPQFRKQYDLVKGEAAQWKAKHDELAIQLGEFTEIAEWVDEAGGKPYLQQAAEVSNLMTNSDAWQQRAGEPDDVYGRRRYASLQKLFDQMYAISPTNAPTMVAATSDYYGQASYKIFIDTFFGAPPTDAQLEAHHAFVANGYQLQAAPTTDSDVLPPYCYAMDEYGQKVEIPENVAYFRSEKRREQREKQKEQQEKQALKKQVESLSNGQVKKTEVDKQAEGAGREQKFREQVLSPVDEIVSKIYPTKTLQTEGKMRQLRSWIDSHIKETVGDELDKQLANARAGGGQALIAEGKLSRLQAKIRLGAGEIAAKWCNIENIDSDVIQAQLTTVKTANAEPSTQAGLSNTVPSRPDRKAVDASGKRLYEDGYSKKWVEDASAHRQKYMHLYPNEKAYMDATTQR